MSGSAGDDDPQGPRTSLRAETARARTLLLQCREDGIPVGALGVQLRTARESISQGRLELAVEQLRRLNLELLETLLWGGEAPALPGGVENPPAPTLPSDDVVSTINRARAWKVRIPKTERPSTEATKPDE